MLLDTEDCLCLFFFEYLFKNSYLEITGVSMTGISLQISMTVLFNFVQFCNHSLVHQGQLMELGEDGLLNCESI